MNVSTPVGRFAPSPTGPLHLGSLVAAVGSFLFARSAGGRWLIRIEDLDSARVLPGSEEEILAALQGYGLEWDGTPVRQSDRLPLYREALNELRASGSAFDCACSRADLRRSASAPAPGEEASELLYPGTCRNGLSDGRPARAVRFRAPDEPIVFDDLVLGRMEDNVARSTGDFVIHRADQVFAYQLAVVVDDADQGVTQVVRGADLLSSTARQITLQRALGLPTPQHGHLPLVLSVDGSKLGKRDGALPLPSLDGTTIRHTLALALRILGLPEVEQAHPAAMLREALDRFEVKSVRREPWTMPTEQPVVAADNGITHGDDSALH